MNGVLAYRSTRKSATGVWVGVSIAAVIVAASTVLLGIESILWVETLVRGLPIFFVVWAVFLSLTLSIAGWPYFAARMMHRVIGSDASKKAIAFFDRVCGWSGWMGFVLFLCCMLPPKVREICKDYRIPPPAAMGWINDSMDSPLFLPALVCACFVIPIAQLLSAGGCTTEGRSMFERISPLYFMIFLTCATGMGAVTAMVILHVIPR